VISADGRAVGDIVTGGAAVGSCGSTVDGGCNADVVISRLWPNLRLAQKALGIRLALQTVKA